MHINTKFEAFKLAKILSVNGVDYEFKRRIKNKFDEYTNEEPELITTIKGIYHEQPVTTQVVTGEGTQYRTQKTPMILCGYNEEVLLLKVGDLVTFNDKTYEVQGITNYKELNIVMDISLRMVDKGGNQI